MKSVKVFLGLITGFASGALAGILFAPKKGVETRKGLMKKGDKYSDELKEKFDGLSKVITKQFEKVKKDVTEYAEKKMKKNEKAETETKTTKDKKS